MAILNEDDFKAYRRRFRADPVAKREYVTSSLSKSEWMAVMQSIEDWFEARRANIKATMVSAAGGPLSN